MKSIQNTYNKNFIKRNVSKIPIKTNIFRIDRKDHFVWSSIFDRTSRFDYEATIQRGKLQPNCNLSTRSWLPHEVLGVEFTHGQFPLLFSLPPHFLLFRKLYL